MRSVAGRLPQLVFCIGAGLFFAYVVVSAFGFPAISRRVPQTVGLIGLAFALIELFASMAQRAHGADEHRSGIQVDLEVDKGIPAGVILKRFSLVFTAILGLVVTIWLLGFYVAIPLFVGLYLKLVGGEPLVRVAAVSAAMFALLVVFRMLFEIYYPPGALQVWFEG